MYSSACVLSSSANVGGVLLKCFWTLCTVWVWSGPIDRTPGLHYNLYQTFKSNVLSPVIACFPGIKTNNLPETDESNHQSSIS